MFNTLIYITDCVSVCMCVLCSGDNDTLLKMLRASLSENSGYYYIIIIICIWTLGCIIIIIEEMFVLIGYKNK